MTGSVERKPLRTFATQLIRPDVGILVLDCHIRLVHGELLFVWPQANVLIHIGLANDAHLFSLSVKPDGLRKRYATACLSYHRAINQNRIDSFPDNWLILDVGYNGRGLSYQREALEIETLGEQISVAVIKQKSLRG